MERMIRIIAGVVFIFIVIQIIPLLLRPIDAYLNPPIIISNFIQIGIIFIVALLIRKRFSFISHVLYVIAVFHIFCTLILMFWNK